MRRPARCPAGGDGPKPADAWEDSIRLLGMRAHSTLELRRRLEQRGHAADRVGTVLARLTTAGYLDDAAYARTWARSGAERRLLGPARLARELKARGIGDAEISITLADVFAERDPGSVAESAAARKLPSLQGLAPAVACRRLAGHLTRQGFSADIILALCRKHFPRHDDFDEQA